MTPRPRVSNLIFIDGSFRNGRAFGVSVQEVAGGRNAAVDHPAFVVRRVEVVVGHVEAGSPGLGVPDQPGSVAVSVFWAGVLGISRTATADNLAHFCGWRKSHK